MDDRLRGACSAASQRGKEKRGDLHTKMSVCLCWPVFFSSKFCARRRYDVVTTSATTSHDSVVVSGLTGKAYFILGKHPPSYSLLYSCWRLLRFQDKRIEIVQTEIYPSSCCTYTTTMRQITPNDAPVCAHYCAVRRSSNGVLAASMLRDHLKPNKHLNDSRWLRSSLSFRCKLVPRWKKCPEIGCGHALLQ